MTNLGIWTNFGEVRGDARSWLMARWKAHGQLSIHVNLTFFAVYYGSGVMRQMCTARRFSQGVDLFALKFNLDSVVPHQPFLASEN